METSVERQKFVRFIPRERAFVAPLSASKLGSIKDINMSGMACEFLVHFGEKQAITGKAATPLQADVFSSANSFHLTKIPCRVAYDACTPEDPPAYAFTITKRRCGLKFDELTEEQDKQVSHFLENYTIGGA